MEEGMRTWLDVVDGALDDLRIHAPIHYTKEVEDAQAVIQYVLAHMLELDWLLTQATDLVEEAA